MDPRFDLFAAFVAINTVMYVALALVRAMPRVHVWALVPRRYQRGETRSIHPDAPS